MDLKNNKVNVKKNRVSTLSYLFLFILMLNSGTILAVTGYNAELLIVSIFFLGLCALLFNKFYPIQILKSFLLCFGLFFLFCVIQSMYLGNIYYSLASNQFFIFTFKILFSSLIIVHFYFHKNEFLLAFNKILFFFCLHAIISNLLYYIFKYNTIALESAYGKGTYLTLGYLFFHRSHYDYFGYITNNAPSLFGVEIYRASGFFWEPSILALFANILLYIYLYYDLKQKKMYLYVSILAIFMTWSTTGYIIFTIQLFFYLIYSKKIKYLFFTIFLLPTIIYILNINLQNKLYGVNAGSSVQRYVDNLASIRAISENPFFGTGISYGVFKNSIDSQDISLKDYTLDVDSKHIKSRTENRASNSLLTLIVMFGMPVSIFIIYFFYRQNLFDNNKLQFFLICLIGVSFTPLLFYSFFFLMIVSGILKTFNQIK